jgi:type IV secretion system protein TrbL
MVLKRADFMEICAELCRYILFTGFFFWLLQNGPAFAGDIINSLRQLGGKAAGGGQSIYPGDLITLGMQVVQNAMQHMNWLMPAVTGLPVLFAVIVLVVCCLIAANLILLICAAWVVLYAGPYLTGLRRLSLD